MSATTLRPARKLLVPALVTAAMLATLIALGLWQLQRREWKRAILADIDRAEASAPTPLPAAPLPFTKVIVEGTPHPGLHALYGLEGRDLPTGPTMGAQLITVLDRPGHPPLLVDRGWIPDAASATPVQPTPVTITGYIRLPDAPATFSPADDLARQHFYTLDPAKIGATFGLPQVAPFTLIALADGSARPAPTDPQPATTLPRPPNDHLNYALTWFGLALSLLAVFAAYCRKTLRSAP